MERRIIKIKGNNKDEENENIREFLYTWVEKMCEIQNVCEFHFISANAIYVKELDYEEEVVREREVMLVFDEEDLRNDFLRKSLEYLEYLFEVNKDHLREVYEKTLGDAQEEERMKNKCIELLKRCSSGEEIVSLLVEEDVNKLLSYLQRHKNDFRYKDILSERKKKMADFLVVAAGIFQLGTIVLTLIMLLSLFFLDLASGVLAAKISTLALIPVGTLSFVLQKESKVYSKRAFERAFEACCWKLEKTESKAREEEQKLTHLLDKTKEYMKVNGKDFSLAETLLEALLKEEKMKVNVSEEERRTVRGMCILQVEKSVYSSVERIGCKKDTPYKKQDVYDFLSYIGVDMDEEQDEVVTSLVRTCMEVLDTPFYGCEYEVTRLLEAVVMYLANRDEMEDCQRAIDEALERRARALKVDGLLDERMALIESKDAGSLVQDELLQRGRTIDLKPTRKQEDK